MSGRELGLNARMQMRKHASGSQVVTEEDHMQLLAYSHKLDEAIALLREEIKDIDEGRLAAVSTIYKRKAELLKWLEFKAPLIESFLRLDVAEHYNLPEKLSTFKNLLEEDGRLLKQIAHVAASISREIHRVINRDSLDGLYGKTGKKISDGPMNKQALDQKI